MRRFLPRPTKSCLASSAILALSCGCAAKPYSFGVQSDYPAPLQGAAIAIQQDEIPHPNLDQVENAIHGTIETVAERFGRDVPNQAEKAELQKQACDLATTYLQQHGIYDVHVEQRTYRPSQQWQRLVENDTMHPFWRYTGGSLSVLRSTLLPPRVFRSDHYNPYTQTLSLNSHNPLNSLQAAADARLYGRSSMPGVKAIAQRIPFVPIAFEIEAARETFGYARAMQDQEMEADLYPANYGAIGRQVVSSSLPFVIGAGSPFYVPPVVRITGSMVGRGVGQGVSYYKFQR